MTVEREIAINKWLGIHCPKCVNNDDRGTDLINCQAECEVQKDVGIACIHYEEYVAENEEIRACAKIDENKLYRECTNPNG